MRLEEKLLIINKALDAIFDLEIPFVQKIKRLIFFIKAINIQDLTLEIRQVLVSLFLAKLADKGYKKSLCDGKYSYVLTAKQEQDIIISMAFIKELLTGLTVSQLPAIMLGIMYKLLVQLAAYTREDSARVALDFQARLFQALRCQLSSGEFFSLENYSIATQLRKIITEILLPARAVKRILFIDFDETLLRKSGLPNGGNYEYWRQWWTALQAQGITIILITQRQRVIGETAVRSFLEKVDCPQLPCVYTGCFMPKAFVIQSLYVSAREQAILLDKMVLLDDQLHELERVEYCQSASCPLQGIQVPAADFTSYTAFKAWSVISKAESALALAPTAKFLLAGSYFSTMLQLSVVAAGLFATRTILPSLSLPKSCGTIAKEKNRFRSKL
ncbi:MAG: hypothetical protein A3E87_06780 [Gammaproteobacteria bacterium RIFCSPHIGHO2_12_FULL_35_23]|nr:MAG: hypothetical protein A3E87_06780 [Gammaproteobacteria bacterium RIFCSPHIGHO2_12_FULL_35_23]